MRLICVACGNYVHFEVDVEMIRSIKPTLHGFVVENSVENGWDDSDSTLRMGVIDVVDYCSKEDMDTLRWDAGTCCHVNSYITCARCGSKRVCVPYQAWSPPKDHVTLEEELKSNRHEFQWLRKERLYADTLPELR
ncbi:unnamed protein product [marine sediment metagenome]|uniref:Uncharacterized protein n=1 Tax=marine sediment metagenome TaxID=412755 RepID=X1IY81_9ZZZZ